MNRSIVGIKMRLACILIAANRALNASLAQVNGSYMSLQVMLATVDSIGAEHARFTGSRSPRNGIQASQIISEFLALPAC
mmetsp:Transcript_84/g.154  ORF Transcript_84/g.154 Transcript_84/m.154 type:complete len:80 (-) Transcript_84:237-476(-)